MYTDVCRRRQTTDQPCEPVARSPRFRSFFPIWAFAHISWRRRVRAPAPYTVCHISVHLPFDIYFFFSLLIREARVLRMKLGILEIEELWRLYNFGWLYLGWRRLFNFSYHILWFRWNEYLNGQFDCQNFNFYSTK